MKLTSPFASLMEFKSDFALEDIRRVVLRVEAVGKIVELLKTNKKEIQTQEARIKSGGFYTSSFDEDLGEKVSVLKVGKKKEWEKIGKETVELQEIRKKLCIEIVQIYTSEPQCDFSRLKVPEIKNEEILRKIDAKLSQAVEDLKLSNFNDISTAKIKKIRNSILSIFDENQF